MTGLFESLQLGEIALANRVVMAPMTRSSPSSEIPCSSEILPRSMTISGALRRIRRMGSNDCPPASTLASSPPAVSALMMIGPLASPEIEPPKVSRMMPVFPASPLRADSESPVACLRPGEEKLAALTPHGPVCPRCRNLHVVRYGKRGGIQRYKCKGCSFHFTDLTGSVLHRMRRRDLWLDFCLCMVKRLSVRDTARRLGISKNTAFAWRHRAISALASADSQTVCQGIVEVAQWPIIRSFKGSRPPEGTDVGHLEPTIRRNYLVYRHFYPRRRLAALVVAVDRSGRARASSRAIHPPMLEPTSTCGPSVSRSSAASASFTICRILRSGCRFGTRASRSTKLNSDPVRSSVPAASGLRSTRPTCERPRRRWRTGRRRRA